MRKHANSVLFALVLVMLVCHPASAARQCAGKDLKGNFSISNGTIKIRKSHVEELKLDHDPLDHGVFINVKLDPRGTAQLKRLTKASLGKEIQIQIGDTQFTEYVSVVNSSGGMQLKPPVKDPSMPPEKLSRAMFDQVCPKPTH